MRTSNSALHRECGEIIRWLRRSDRKLFVRAIDSKQDWPEGSLEKALLNDLAALEAVRWATGFGMPAEKTTLSRVYTLVNSRIEKWPLDLVVTVHQQWTATRTDSVYREAIGHTPVLNP